MDHQQENKSLMMMMTMIMIGGVDDNDVGDE